MGKRLETVRTPRALTGLAAILLLAFASPAWGREPAAGQRSSAAQTAVAPATVSGELPVADPVYERAGLRDPAVAFDGTNFMVVGVGGLGPTTALAARVSPSGRVHDPLGIFVAKAYDSSPDVAWNGTEFLVVWRDSDGIRASRLTADGEVLDRGGFRVGTSSHSYEPVVASDGADFMVAWEQSSRATPRENVYAARVSGSGELLDSPPLPIATGPTNEGYPAVAWNGADYLIAWTVLHTQDSGGAETDIQARLVASSGTITPSFIIADPRGDQYRPDMMAEGSTFFVVWDDRHPNASPRIVGARVSGSGVVLDPRGILIAEGDYYLPSVAWSGSEFLVAWNVGISSTAAARVSPEGAVLDPQPIVISGSGFRPDVSWGGTDFLVVVGIANRGGFLVSPEGQVLNPKGFAISRSANNQAGPAVAWDGAEFLVVWGDNRREGRSFGGIYGTRISATGEILDGTGFRISPSSNNARDLAVAWGGSTFLVTWEGVDSNYKFDVFATRVAPDGQVLDPNGIRVSTARQDETDPVVAWDGSDFLVVWTFHGHNGFAFDKDILGARVTEDGQVLDPSPLPVWTGAGSQKSPRVASNGVESLVVWQDPQSGGNHIQGTRVGQDGSILDPSALDISAGAPGSEILPSVASDGRDFLVAWQDLRADHGDIYASRVTSDGEVLDSRGIPVATGQQSDGTPAVTWDGANFVSAWERCPPEALFFCYDVDVYGARISNAGVVLDPGGVPVSTSRPDELYPAVSSGPNGQVAVLYQRRAHGPFVEAVRVFLRFIDDPGDRSPSDGPEQAFRAP